MLRGEPPYKFTVAKTSWHKFLDPSSFGHPSQLMDFYDEWEVASLEPPEIVATGSRIRKQEPGSEGDFPIALYPRDEEVTEAKHVE